MYTDKNKYKGGFVSSSNVAIQGKTLTFVDEVPCDMNLNELIALVDESLKQLEDGNDFSILDPKSLDFDPADTSNVEILQELIDGLDTTSEGLNTLKQSFEDLDVGDAIIEIDLGCLTPEAMACEQGTNKYTLKSLLILFKNEICDLKS